MHIGRVEEWDDAAYDEDVMPSAGQRASDGDAEGKGLCSGRGCSQGSVIGVRRPETERQIARRRRLGRTNTEKEKVVSRPMRSRPKKATATWRRWTCAHRMHGLHHGVDGFGRAESAEGEETSPAEPKRY